MFGNQRFDTSCWVCSPVVAPAHGCGVVAHDPTHTHTKTIIFVRDVMVLAGTKVSRCCRGHQPSGLPAKKKSAVMPSGGKWELQ